MPGVAVWEMWVRIFCFFKKGILSFDYISDDKIPKTVQKQR